MEGPIRSKDEGAVASFSTYVPSIGLVIDEQDKERARMGKDKAITNERDFFILLLCIEMDISTVPLP